MRSTWMFSIILLLLTTPLLTNASIKRHRVIEFEDEVVEGMNKRPLDSLSQLSEKNRRNLRPHIYKKRVGFREESFQTLSDMRYSP